MFQSFSSLMVASGWPRNEVHFEDVSQAPSFAGLPGFKHVIFKHWQMSGIPSAAFRGFGSGPAWQGRENLGVCSPFLHACLSSPREETCLTISRSRSPGALLALSISGRLLSVPACPGSWSPGRAEAANPAAGQPGCPSSIS